MNLYPFTLKFADSAARFPFVFEGAPISDPFCLVSARSAGDMAFAPEAARTGAASGRIHGPVREAFFRFHNIPAGRVYSLVQIHSRYVYPISGGAVSGSTGGTQPDPAAFVRQGDGMVSFSREVFPAVTVADCLPVFLLDTEHGFFAVLHSGWKGTGIALNALSIMREAGTRPEAAAAVLGPCIQDCCYRVDADRARAFEDEFGEGSTLVPPGAPYPLGPVVEYRDSGAYIGLQAANARLLAGAGIRHIAYCTDCTFTDERLGSYRREGAGYYTRMIAAAGYF